MEKGDSPNSNLESDKQEPVLKEELGNLEDGVTAEEKCLQCKIVENSMAKFIVDNRMVKFIVGEEKVVFEEDILVLLKASPVFEQMFLGSLREEGPVFVPDVTSNAFSVMLQFLKNKKFPLPKDDIPSVLFLAEKYMIQKLKKACVRAMQPVTTETVCSVLNFALMFNIEQLKKDALQVFMEKTDSVVGKQVLFNLLTKEALTTIIQCETVKNTSELQIFNAVLEWAKAQCNQEDLPCDGETLRQQLGGVLKHIRLLIMNSEDFSEVKRAGVLSSQEVEEYEEYTKSKGAATPKHLFPVARPRNNLRNCNNLRVASRRVVLVNYQSRILSYNSGDQLKEEFKFDFDGFVTGIILPTQINTQNKGHTYLEEVTVSTDLESVYFRAEVCYDKEICVPFTRSAKSKLYRVSVIFRVPGYYPFYEKRKFDTDKIVQIHGGIVVGFEFSRNCSF